MEIPVSTGGQVAVIGNDHNSGWSNYSLRNSWLPGLWIRVECAWANTWGLKYHYFFPPKLYPSPPDSGLLGHRSLRRGLGGCTLMKEASAGDASTRGPEYLVTSPWSPGLIVEPPSFGCTLNSGHSQGKPGKTGLRGVSWRALCCPQSSHGTQHYPRSRDQILSQIMKVNGHKLGFTFHSCSFLYSHADVILKYSWFAFLCLSPVFNGLIQLWHIHRA